MTVAKRITVAAIAAVTAAGLAAAVATPAPATDEGAASRVKTWPPI